jgi:RNA polymerase sigma-70 factor (ECF subfamily)
VPGSRFNAPEFLEALRHGDSNAWRALYEEQWRPLCAFIRARLTHTANGRTDSEDLAQEVFCRAFTGITRFRGEARLETWLQAIAHYAIVDARRASQREGGLRAAADAPEHLREGIRARATADPETYVVGRDRLTRLQREVSAILGGYADLFIKRHLEDLSEEEVAAATALKRGTASGRLGKARRLLRQHGSRLAPLLRG